MIVERSKYQLLYKKVTITHLSELMRDRNRNERFAESASLHYAIDLQLTILKLLSNHRGEVSLQQLTEESQKYRSLCRDYDNKTREYHQYPQLILVAMERQDERELVQNTLEREDNLVLSASNDSEVLELVYLHPHVILIDINLQKNTIEVCRKLKRYKRYSDLKKIPIILYSQTKKEDVQEIAEKNEVYTILQTPLSLINIQRVFNEINPQAIRMRI